MPEISPAVLWISIGVPIAVLLIAALLFLLMQPIRAAILVSLECLGAISIGDLFWNISGIIPISSFQIGSIVTIESAQLELAPHSLSVPALIAWVVVLLFSLGGWIALRLRGLV